MADHHAGPLCLRASAPMNERENRCDAFLLSALEKSHHGFLVPVPEVGWGVMIPQPLSELTAQVESGPTRGVVGDWHGAACAPSFGVLVSRCCRPLCAVLAWSPSVLQWCILKHCVHALGVLQHAARSSHPGHPVSTLWRMNSPKLQARVQVNQRFRAFAEIAADWFWEMISSQWLL